MKQTPCRRARSTPSTSDPSRRVLSGAVLEGWYAKRLRNEHSGLATWSEAEIVDFLQTGRTERAAAFGGMAEVVEHSTAHLTEQDPRSMAAYLKQLPRRTANTPADARASAGLDAEQALRDGDYRAAGARGYAEHCQACHRADGRGAPRIHPALAGNSIVFADDPSSLIQVTLAGGRMPHTAHDRMAFSMPGFASLPNRELADILTFIRTGWGNQARPVGERDVAGMRRVIANKPTHVVSAGAQP